MKPAMVRTMAVVAMLALPVFGAIAYRSWNDHAGASRGRAAGAPAVTVPESRAITDSVAFAAARSAAFRSSRLAARMRFDARRPEAPAAQPGPRPALTLAGIVWGRMPTAVLEGLPGIDGGRLVSKGEVINGVTIREITRGSVTAAGLDTTWTLRLREAWR